MGLLPTLLNVLARWYISGLLAISLGLIAGFLIALNLFPGTPKIGIIDIPSTVITEETAFIIGAMLDHARDRSDIEAVVIKLDSPGGEVAASEELYLKTRKLRKRNR